MAQFSIRVRDAKTGTERSLATAFFSGFTSRADAEDACAWYRESAHGAVRGSVDVYVTEDLPVDRMPNAGADADRVLVSA